jgi:transposase-like protein
MGRRPRDPEREQRWRASLIEQRESGLSVREFCLREGLKETAFHYWRRRISEEDGQPSTKPAKRGRPRSVTIAAAAEPSAASPAHSRSAKFVPVRWSTIGEGAGYAAEVALPGGVTLRLARDVDGAMLQMLLAALRQPC